MQLVFSRLPEFSEDLQLRTNMKVIYQSNNNLTKFSLFVNFIFNFLYLVIFQKLKMRTGVVDQNSSRSSKRKGRTVSHSKHSHHKVDASSVPNSYAAALGEILRYNFLCVLPFLSSVTLHVQVLDIFHCTLQKVK